MIWRTSSSRRPKSERCVPWRFRISYTNPNSMSCHHGVHDEPNGLRWDSNVGCLVQWLLVDFTSFELKTPVSELFCTRREKTGGWGVTVSPGTSLLPHPNAFSHLEKRVRGETVTVVGIWIASPFPWKLRLYSNLKIFICLSWGLLVLFWQNYWVSLTVRVLLGLDTNSLGRWVVLSVTSSVSTIVHTLLFFNS